MSSDSQPRSTEGNNSEVNNFHPEKKLPGQRNFYNRGFRNSEGEREDFRQSGQQNDFILKNKDGIHYRRDKNPSSFGYGDVNLRQNNTYRDQNSRDYKSKNSYNQNATTTNTGHYQKNNHYHANASQQFTRTGHISNQSSLNRPFHQSGQSSFSQAYADSNFNKFEHHRNNYEPSQGYTQSTLTHYSKETAKPARFDPSNFTRQANHGTTTQANSSPSTKNSFDNNHNQKDDTVDEKFESNHKREDYLAENDSTIRTIHISSGISKTNTPTSSSPSTLNNASSNKSSLSFPNSNEVEQNDSQVFKNSSSETASQNNVMGQEFSQQDNQKSPVGLKFTSQEPPNLAVQTSHNTSSISSPSGSTEKSNSSALSSNKESDASSPSVSLESQSLPTSGTPITSNSPVVSTPPATKPTSTWKSSRSSATSRLDNLERQTKSLLNKLTIEKFPTITEQLAVLEESLKDDSEMQLFVNLVVGKAISEPDWSEMYADVCLILFWRSPYFVKASQNSFRLALISKIESEFIALPKVLDLPEEKKKELEQHVIELEIKKMKNHILGVITLIGELFQRKLLAYKVVYQVVLELVINTESPDEHIIECFLQLICTTGYHIDQNEAIRNVLDLWFGRLKELHNRDTYSKRLKYVIQNVLDLRKSNWLRKIHKDKAKGLNEIRGQLEKEDYLGGATHAASYGKIETVGKPVNASTNNHYAAHLHEQEARYISKKQHSSKTRPNTPP